MGRFGDAIGAAVRHRGVVVLFEAIFLGIYLYDCDRIPPRTHLLTIVLLGVSGVVDTFCMTSVNAWGNIPACCTMRGSRYRRPPVARDVQRRGAA